LIDLYELLDQELGIEKLLIALADAFSLPEKQALSLLKKQTCVTPINLKTVKKIAQFKFIDSEKEL
jgi:hypothetical protein